MTESRERVEQALAARGVTDRMQVFATSVPTAAAAAEQLGCETGAIANSLVLKVGNDVVLVLASGAHRVDTAKVARLLGVGRTKVRRADPETVLAVTGQEVGGVAPVGHPAPLRTIVDEALTTHTVVWAGGGDHHSMFATTTDELVAITDGALADIGDDRPCDPH